MTLDEKRLVGRILSEKSKTGLLESLVRAERKPTKSEKVINYYLERRLVYNYD